MAKLFTFIIKTERKVNVVAETQEEAQGKVPLGEGEVIATVIDNGDVTV